MISNPLSTHTNINLLFLFLCFLSWINNNDRKETDQLFMKHIYDNNIKQNTKQHRSRTHKTFEWDRKAHLLNKPFFPLKQNIVLYNFGDTIETEFDSKQQTALYVMNVLRALFKQKPVAHEHFS